MSQETKPSSKIRIGIAQTPQEKERIYRFRYEVYVTEMRKQKLAYADHEGKRLVDELDEDAILMSAEAEGELVATVRRNVGRSPHVLSHYGDVYRLGDFDQFPDGALSFSSRLMIAKNMRGSMALHLLLTAAYEHAVENGILFDFCNCAPCLVGMYEHLGFRQFSDNFVDPEVGYRVPMALLFKDMGHLRAVRSPFSRKLRSFPKEVWENEPSSAWFAERFPVSQYVIPWLLSDVDLWRFLAEKLQNPPEQTVPLLGGLAEEEAKRVLERGVLLKSKKDDVVIRAHDVGSEMYVILSGVLEVRSPSGNTTLASFGPGEIIGEIGLVLDCERTANVVAVQDSEILVIDRSYINRMMSNDPALAAKVLLNLCRVVCERLITSTRTRVQREEETSA